MFNFFRKYMKITKEKALAKIEELKKYVAEEDAKKEEKVIGIAIRNKWTGEIIFQSTKTTYQEAIIEKGDADLCDADLRGANLCDANLRGANLYGANLCGANLCDANLRGADLCDADLRDAEMMNVKFYGKGGTKKLKRAQLPDFLAALGFIVVD